MTSAADLFALQDIDLKRDSRRALLADIESRLGESEELIAAREALSESEGALSELQRQQRELEAQLQDLDAKIRPVETKLYDGSVRNPKELTDLQRDVDSLKGRRSRLDDEGLAILERVEIALSDAAAKREGLKAAESAWQTQQGELLSDRERAQRERIALDGERDRWTTEMDRHVLQLYESLRAKHQGRAVARVERGTCQGCRIGLPTHIIQRVRTGTVLVQCPTCERILAGV
jgi:predicted  nucleic acid-binding Zn-ribbon protein